MRIGIADDGFKLKAKLTLALNGAGYKVEDFVTHELVISDDFPDVVLPMYQN